MPPSRRLFAAAAVAALVLAGCSAGDADLDKVRRELKEEDEGKSTDQKKGASTLVRPPPAANPSLTGRVGLILVTNSRTFAKLLGSPAEAGVTVLFVQPGGPSDGTGIGRGDVITKVGTETIQNAERGVIALRARPDERKTVEFVKPDGSRKTITVQAKVPPANVNLLPTYAKLIEASPQDAVLYFLRAQAFEETKAFDEIVADTNKAVDLEPAFVEAISLRAEKKWERARRLREAAQVEQLRDEALADWKLALDLDPQNTRVLVSRSRALSAIKQARSARRDAEKARTADQTFPGAHHAVALAETQLTRYADAAEPARRAVDLNPFDARYYHLLGLIFCLLDRPADSRKTVEAILDLVDDTASQEELLKATECKKRRTKPQ